MSYQQPSESMSFSNNQLGYANNYDPKNGNYQQDNGNEETYDSATSINNQDNGSSINHSNLDSSFQQEPSFNSAAPNYQLDSNQFSSNYAQPPQINGQNQQMEYQQPVQEMQNTQSFQYQYQAPQNTHDSSDTQMYQYQSPAAMPTTFRDQQMGKGGLGSVAPSAQAMSDSSAMQTRNIKDRRLSTPMKQKWKDTAMREYVDLNQVYQRQNLVDKDIVCDICLSEYPEDGDEIIVCENWLVAVHQSCYGKDIKDQVPKNDWNWERCNYILDKKNNDYSYARCKLCRKYEGALTKVGMYWYHIQWVNWTSEIYWTDEDKKDKICGSLSKTECVQVAKQRWNYCQLDECYCIRCDMNDCKEVFCVRCATKNKFIKSDENMDEQRHPDEEDVIYIFCHAHQPEGYSLIKDKDFSKFRCDPEKIEAERQKQEKNIKKRRKHPSKKSSAQRRTRSHSPNRSLNNVSKKLLDLENKQIQLENTIRMLWGALWNNQGNFGSLGNMADISWLFGNNMGPSVLPSQLTRATRLKNRSINSVTKNTGIKKKATSKKKKGSVVSKRRNPPKKSNPSNNYVNSTEKLQNNVNGLNMILDQFNNSLNIGENVNQNPNNQTSQAQAFTTQKYELCQDLKKLWGFRNNTATKEEVQEKLEEYARERNLVENTQYVILFRDPKLQSLIGTDLCQLNDMTNRLIASKKMNLITFGSAENNSETINLNVRKQKGTRVAGRWNKRQKVVKSASEVPPQQMVPQQIISQLQPPMMTMQNQNSAGIVDDQNSNINSLLSDPSVLSLLSANGISQEAINSLVSGNNAELTQQLTNMVNNIK